MRLSREDEKLGESGSIATQRDLLLSYIRDNNLLFIDEYIDDGVSGTTFDRVGFKRMIRDCCDKRINMIITKDTSRLGRDHIEFGYYVERFFPENNIRYVAVNDGIDTFNNNNSLNDMLVFKSVFNDMYVKDISNKLRSSLYIKKKNGLFVGCYAPYGYKKSDKDKHILLIDEEASLVVKRIFELFINGNSLAMICDILTREHIPTPSIYKNMKIGQGNYHYGIWSSRTVSDILRNPTYIGNLTQCRQKKVSYKSKKRVHTDYNEWIIAEGAVPAIIDKYTFDLVQDMFKSNKNCFSKGSGITSKLLLRGLIYCKECHHKIGFREVRNRNKSGELVSRIYGNCNYWVKRKKYNVCTPHSVKYDYIEDIVFNRLSFFLNTYINDNYLFNLINNSNRIMGWKNNIKQELFRIDMDIGSINKKIDSCYNDKLDGNITIDVYKRIYNKLILEIDKLKLRRKKCCEKLLSLENYKFEVKYCLDIFKKLLDLKSLSLINLLIDRIEIDEDKNIYIYYKFREK